MDQSRQENTNNQQQNVHLHMHHVCTCQSGLYPSSYYPAVGYRTHVPPMMTYTTPQPIATRPYLQHYQYTQFNVGSQYTVPLSHVSPVSSVYGTSNLQHNLTSSDVSFGQTSRERRERNENQDSTVDSDRLQNEPPVGYEFGQITPPANELLLSDNPDNMQTSTDNFVKFLEKSCLTAEQIAYRNRNRPCFRNIQNLCIRTRSEILKPCTTISNIHSQGIPWATKDFIYAFVRLTNCWHILKGYWENRDGCSLGKIEKELTPEFRACYVRWEKETIELAAQLTRVFYNLDTNLNNPGPVVNVPNNLIPPQVNFLKTSSSENTIKNNWSDTLTSASSATVTITNNSSKNVRGILHLPAVSSATPAETVDQGNQTCAGDFCARGEEENNTDEEGVQSRVYMKPGSYCVPKKHNVCTSTANNESSSCANNNSPRTIEFFETAQNVNRVLDAVKKAEQKVIRDEVKIKNVEPIEAEFEVPPQFNVHEWLINSRFSDYGEPSSPPTSPTDISPFFMDSMFPHHENLSHLQVNMEPFERTAITLLQRDKMMAGKSSTSIAQSNGKIDVSKVYNKKRNDFKNSGSVVVNAKREKISFYEENDGGLTAAGAAALEKVLRDVRMADFACLLAATKDNLLYVNLEGVQKKIKAKCYDYIFEAVKDILQCIRSATVFLDSDSAKKVEVMLWDLFDQNFPGYDLSELKQDGSLAKAKGAKFEGDGDH